MIEEAIEVATDPDYRFELAIQLGRLEVAQVSLDDMLGTCNLEDFVFLSG